MDLNRFSEKEIEDLMNQCFVPKKVWQMMTYPENVETICKKGDLW
jgi:hypothetical protein